MTLQTHIPIDLNAIARECHEISSRHGFWNVLGAAQLDEGTQATTMIALGKLMLVTTEVAEAAEVIRDGRPLQKGPLGLEFADIIIRVLDLSAGFDIDIDDALAYKMAVNRGRPVMHGKKA